MKIIFLLLVFGAFFYVIRNFTVYIIPAFFNFLGILIQLIFTVFLFFFGILGTMFRILFRIKPKEYGKVTISDTYSDTYKTKSGILRNRTTTIGRNYSVDKRGSVIGKRNKSIYKDSKDPFSKDKRSIF